MILPPKNAENAESGEQEPSPLIPTHEPRSRRRKEAPSKLREIFRASLRRLLRFRGTNRRSSRAVESLPSDGRGNWLCALCALLRPFSGFIPLLALLLFLGALFWAKGRDPFQRRWFNIKSEGFPKAECIAVLPKMAVRPLPVIIYLHGSGGNLMSDGNDLRHIAEMGLAAVGMEYNQTNGVAFAAQFTALNRYLQRQRWADTNAIAWVGFSLGAQRTLAFALTHPDMKPSLLVRISGGWIQELENQKVESRN